MILGIKTYKTIFSGENKIGSKMKHTTTMQCKIACTSQNRISITWTKIESSRNRPKKKEWNKDRKNQIFVLSSAFCLLLSFFWEHNMREEKRKRDFVSRHRRTEEREKSFSQPLNPIFMSVGKREKICYSSEKEKRRRRYSENGCFLQRDQLTHEWRGEIFFLVSPENNSLFMLPGQRRRFIDPVYITGKI